MSDPNHCETIWARGLRDTKQCLHSFWFWGLEVIGGGLIAMFSPIASFLFVIGVLFAVWIGATVGAPFRQRNEARISVEVLKTSLEQKEAREARRAALGAFLTEGRALLQIAYDETKPIPQGFGEDWLTRLTEYLKNTDGFGSAYVDRLNNPVGLPLRTTSIQSKPHRDVEGGIKFRLARLDQFLSEMGD